MFEAQRQLIWVFFLTIFLFVVWQLAQIFSPFFQAFFWAAILSFAFYPLHERLLQRIKRPNLAALLTTVIIISIVILPALTVLVNLLNQTFEIYQHLSSVGFSEIIDEVQGWGWFQSLRDQVMATPLIADYILALPAKLTRMLGAASTGFITSITKNTLLISFNFIIMLFMIFFITRDGRRMYHFVYDLIPFDKKDRRVIFQKINDTFASVIRGQFFTSITQGLLAGFTFLVLGLPAAYFFGFLTFLSSLVPVIGSSGVWLPMAIYLFVKQEIVKGIALLVIGTLVISLADNVLKPLVIGQHMKLPPFLLFFGILGGLKLYGMMGMFLGPLVITLFFVLVQIYQVRYRPS